MIHGNLRNGFIRIHQIPIGISSADILQIGLKIDFRIFF